MTRVAAGLILTARTDLSHDFEGIRRFPMSGRQEE